MFGILTKLSENKNAFRTKSIFGWFNELPQIEDNFSIYNNQPLSIEEGLRTVITSPVQEMTLGEKTIIFKTLNSTYQLDYKLSFGFTGTRKGMTAEQKKIFKEFLSMASSLTHGDCVGAYKDAHDLASEAGRVASSHGGRPAFV